MQSTTALSLDGAEHLPPTRLGKLESDCVVSKRLPSVVFGHAIPYVMPEPLQLRLIQLPEVVHCVFLCVSECENPIP